MTCTIPLGIGQQAQLPQQGPGQRTGTKKVLGHNAGVGGGQSSDAVAQVGYKLQNVHQDPLYGYHGPKQREQGVMHR